MMRLVASTEPGGAIPAAARSRWPSRLVLLGCLAGGLWLAGLVGHSQPAQADPARPLPLAAQQPAEPATNQPVGPLDTVGEALKQGVAGVHQVTDGVLASLPAGSIALTPDITVTLPISLTPPVVTPPVVAPPVVTPPVVAPPAHPRVPQAKPATHPASPTHLVPQPGLADAGARAAATPRPSPATAGSTAPGGAGHSTSQPVKPPRPTPTPIDPTGYLTGNSEATDSRGGQDSPQLMAATDARPVYRPLIVAVPVTPSPAATDRAARPPISPD
ncbi:MAG: hypothetical protein ABIP57_02855 [Jatrophihabitantaceae bacterium]